MLLAGVRRAAAEELCDCEALLGRVHVEKEAVAAEMGAMMVGG
jgi:hypothetical protein